jgi:Peptidase M50B-like
MTSSSSRGTRSTSWVLVGVVAATLLLYRVPYGRYLAYPLVLLSTFAHEMGHGTAALLVGGEFTSLEMAADASGLAQLRIPGGRLARAFTSAGGLVGPACLAALFFVLARRPKSAHVGLLVFGIASLVALLVVVRSVVGALFVGALGAACLFLGAHSSARVAQWVLAFMAVQLGLSVFSRGDYLFMKTAGNGPSDVAQMAAALFLPYWFWGIVCGALSCLVLILGIRAYWRSGLKT